MRIRTAMGFAQSVRQPTPLEPATMHYQEKALLNGFWRRISNRVLLRNDLSQVYTADDCRCSSVGRAIDS
jgi:hypothetical protein